MKLIVGLGNPEPKYDNTRHNVGHHIIDSFASSRDATLKPQPKFKADIAEIYHGDEKVLLAKPATYYNLSGEAVREIADFYKIGPSDILVIHDELMLPFGTIRTRLGGSDAGNNGVKSVNEHMGPTTARIRVGVYNELRDRMDDANFVLGKFTADETKRLAEVAPKLHELIDSFISSRFETTTHR